MAAKSILNDAFVMTEPTHKPIKKKNKLEGQNYKTNKTGPACFLN